jgi:hypothetical protein
VTRKKESIYNGINSLDFSGSEFNFYIQRIACHSEAAQQLRNPCHTRDSGKTRQTKSFFVTSVLSAVTPIFSRPEPCLTTESTKSAEIEVFRTHHLDCLSGTIVACSTSDHLQPID